MALAQQFEGQAGIDPMLYRQAAKAASAGEPLIVECTVPEEVHQMAALFGTLGIRPPTVEELSVPSGATRINGTDLGG